MSEKIDTLSPEDRELHDAFFEAYRAAFTTQQIDLAAAVGIGADVNLDACLVAAIKAMIDREIVRRQNAPRIVSAVGVGKAVRPPKYSAAWIRDEVEANGWLWLRKDECGGCDYTLAFLFSNGGLFRDGGVFFDPGCDCDRGNVRTSSFSEIAEWLAMQASDDIRDYILKGFRK